MEDLICLDSSVLIEYFRKKNKSTALFPKLALRYSGFKFSIAVHFEIYSCCTQHQKLFWDNLFSDMFITPFNTQISFKAINILKELKAMRQTIEFKDLVIAATSLNHNFPLATLNEKHFNKIQDLKLITDRSFL